MNNSYDLAVGSRTFSGYRVGHPSDFIWVQQSSLFFHADIRIVERRFDVRSYRIFVLLILSYYQKFIK